MADRALAGAQKKAEREERTLVWVDETAFYLLPSVVRTYAPRGQTPVLTVPLSRDHLSAIGAVTADGRLLVRQQTHSVNGPAVVRFLQHLLQHVPGKLLVLWDGAPIHRCQAVKDFLAAGAAARLHLERLPAYAPELNPTEGIWRYLKRVALRNLCCHELWEVTYELRLALRRLRRQPHLLHACFAHAGCSL